MKKNYLYIIIILVFIFEILTNSNSIMGSVSTSFNIWKNSLFPALFPMFVFSSILIDLGIIEIIAKSKSNILKKLFNINSSSLFIFIMSMFSGFPSSAKYINELYNKKLLTKYEAEKIILFSHFANPMFIIGTISLSFLNNKNLCFIIIFSHYIVNFIIGLCIRSFHINDDSNIAISSKNINIGTSISKSILNAINTLLLILGTVTFFLIITTIIDVNFNLNLPLKTIIFSITEMTQGIRHISLLNISLKLKCTFITMILSFGGLSIHLQTFSIINDLKIKYSHYLLSRIVHCLLSGIITFLLFDFFY